MRIEISTFGFIFYSVALEPNLGKKRDQACYRENKTQLAKKLGVSRFEDLGELFEAIAQAIYYYNHDRIHTSLGTSPVKFRQNHDVLVREYLYKELGT